MEPKAVYAAVGRGIGFEKPGFTRLGRIGDVEEADAGGPAFDFLVAHAFLIDRQRIAEDIDILALYARIVFDFRRYLGPRRIAHVENRESLIVRNIGVFAVLA